VYFKAKDSYHARCVEYEKLKRENASPKDLDKIEAKYKKASEFNHCQSTIVNCDLVSVQVNILIVKCLNVP